MEKSQLSTDTGLSFSSPLGNSHCAKCLGLSGSKVFLVQKDGVLLHSESRVLGGSWVLSLLAACLGQMVLPPGKPSHLRDEVLMTLTTLLAVKVQRC